MKTISLVDYALITFMTVCINSTYGDTNRTLDIYFLDMEGGASTLIVTPMGQSILIDTGSLYPAHRDATRILQACSDAGLTQIDYLITTHFDYDHYGAIKEVSDNIKVLNYMDNGSVVGSRTEDILYQQATGGNAKTLIPGDDIPLTNDATGGIAPLSLHCVASGKVVEGFRGDIDAPVEGFEFHSPDTGENAKSIALVLKYGSFKFFAGGDITWNVEHHLAYPNNVIGAIDLYQISHHGLDLSNNPLFLEALSPKVCIALNGPTKGIGSRTFRDVDSVPSVQAIYQLHYNIESGNPNTDSKYIANDSRDSISGNYIKASVDLDAGQFTMSIPAKNAQFSYPILSASGR